MFPARNSNPCWSLIETDDNVRVGVSYEPGERKIKEACSFVSKRGESANIRRQNYREAVD